MTTFSEKDQEFMARALELAQQAAQLGETPVGAVVVRNGEIIGEGSNRRENLKSPLAHAEIEAILQASRTLQSWRLLDCTLYVTLEPCPMCAGAIVQARVPRVVFGARDQKAGAAKSLYQLLEDPRLNHRAQVEEGLLATNSAQLLKDFFRNLRAQKL